MKNNRKPIIPVILGILIIIIAVVFMLPRQSKGKAAFLEANNLDGLSVEQIVAKLEHETSEEPNMYAAITATKLILGDDYNQYNLNIPSDKFYLSIAPYINMTHPCGNHNLITCRGELQNKMMHIIVKDYKGNIIVDDDFTSYNNGFIGVWLPSNIKGTITISYNGLSATTDINTSSRSNTCLTTMKLG